MSLTTKQKEKINKIKTALGLYYKGVVTMGIASVSKTGLEKLMITNLTFVCLETGKVDLTITLERPDILIGRRGKDLAKLKEYLRDTTDINELFIEKSKIWSLLN